MRIRPERIVVTSNYSIDEIFGYDPTLCLAIRRRFVEVEWTVASRVIEPAATAEPALLEGQHPASGGETGRVRAFDAAC